MSVVRRLRKDSTHSVQAFIPAIAHDLAARILDSSAVGKVPTVSIVDPGGEADGVHARYRIGLDLRTRRRVSGAEHLRTSRYGQEVVVDTHSAAASSKLMATLFHWALGLRVLGFGLLRTYGTTTQARYVR